MNAPVLPLKAIDFKQKSRAPAGWRYLCGAPPLVSRLKPKKNGAHWAPFLSSTGSAYAQRERALEAASERRAPASRRAKFESFRRSSTARRSD